MDKHNFDLKKVNKEIYFKKNNRISIISNITLSPIISTFLMNNKIYPNNKYDFIPLELCLENSYEYISLLRESDIIVILFNLNCRYPQLVLDIHSKKRTIDEYRIEIIKELNRIKKTIDINKKALVIWFGLEDFCYNLNFSVGNIPKMNYLIDTINIFFKNELDSRTIFIDLKAIIARLGIDNAYNMKYNYRWNCPYSISLIELICREIDKQILIFNGKTYKCLVLDCDNVLWGGVLSEDGYNKIVLSSNGIGKAYQDFQRFVLSLYYYGIIIAVCSKNDFQDVIKVFREHDEMILKEEHIACFYVNWNKKTDNIRMIAQTLNIGLDSIVFVDDSIIEIENVNTILPEVFTIQFYRYMTYESFSCFNLKNDVDQLNIENRNKTYQTNHLREALKANFNSNEDYINALKITVDIHKTKPIEYNRISEITQRTNRCTNGKRLTVAEIKEHIEIKKVYMYSVSLCDKFSNLGIVGVIEIENNTLTLFSLSCRALGIDVENRMIEHIVSNHNIKNIRFFSTYRNECMKEFLLNSFPEGILDE